MHTVYLISTHLPTLALRLQFAIKAGLKSFLCCSSSLHISGVLKIAYDRCSKISNSSCLPKKVQTTNVYPDQTASEEAA